MQDPRVGHTIKSEWVPVTAIILDLPYHYYLDPRKNKNRARIVWKGTDWHIEVETHFKLHKGDRRERVGEARVIGPQFDFLGEVKLTRDEEKQKLYLRSLGRPKKFLRRRPLA